MLIRPELGLHLVGLLSGSAPPEEPPTPPAQQTPRFGDEVEPVAPEAAPAQPLEPAPVPGLPEGAPLPPPAAPYPAVHDWQQVRVGETIRVRIEDGRHFAGEVVRIDGEVIVIDEPGSGEVELHPFWVTELERDFPLTPLAGSWVRSNPNRTRYLFTPSAMPLGRGEAYFSQKALLSEVAVGVTDFWAISASTALPLYFTLDGYNFSLGTKFGVSLGKNVHLAAGATSLMLPGWAQLRPNPQQAPDPDEPNPGAPTHPVEALVVPFGTFTLGDAESQLSFSLGAPVGLTPGFSDSGHLMFTLAGFHRLGNRAGLVTEHWGIATSAHYDRFLVFDSVAARLIGRRSALDLGVVYAYAPGAQNPFFLPIPLPWIDYTFNFGQRPDPEKAKKRGRRRAR